MSDQPTPATNAADTGPLSPAGVRALKIAIVVMGVMIVLGVFTIIGRIFYMASVKSAPSASSQTLVGEAVLALPASAVVKSLALDGDRVAVHYDAPTGSGVAILDAASGRTLTRWRIEVEAPRR